MKLPDKTKPTLLGAAAGAAALAVVGFTWGGWTTTSTADKMANELAFSEVVKVLAPICVHQFQQQVDAGEKLTALKATATYQRTAFIEDGGWAVMAGSDKSHSGIAKACANLLTSVPN